MTDIAGERAIIQQEEVRYRAAVSEATGTKIGKSVNFINFYQHSEKQFFANGTYGNAPTFPQTYVDGLIVFNFNAEIINVWAFSSTPGSGGTTELDIKRSTAPGNAFTSIFSTTPKFTSAHSVNGVWVDSAGFQPAVTGVTAPVLLTTSVDQGDALRLDIITSMTGVPSNAGITVIYRPR